MVILGGGVLGNSIAFHLSGRARLSILVVERAANLGMGSTSKATGGFRAQFDNELDVRLSLLSRRKLHAFREETGVDPGYEPRGYLFLARSEAELELLRQNQRLQHACGLDEAEMLTPAGARKLNPAITDPELAGAAFCDSDGFLRPMDLLRGYEEGARRAGVRYDFGVEFLKLQTDGARAVAAITNHGPVEAATFIIALGAWAGAPIVPIRRNVAATATTTLLRPDAPMTIWSGDWFHFRARDGRVLLLWPDDPPLANDEEWMTRVASMTRERAAPLGELPIEQRWSGFYEMTPDGHPLVGRHPTLENVYLAAGCCGHGVMHAPAIGELLTELIVDGRTSLDITALDPARFHT